MKEIQSLQNNIIKETLKLKEKKMRNIANKFIVEGYHLVNEAYHHGLLRAIFSTKIEDLNIYNVKDCYLVNDAIIKKLSSTINPQGIIGVVQKPSYSEIDLTKDSLKLVLLDDINDPGNLGSIVRTSAALGYDGIYMSNETVDIFNEKALRATQGAIFKIPCFYLDLKEIVLKLKQNKIVCLGTTLDSSIYLDEVQEIKKYAVTFGNEARGMKEELKQLMNQNIKIKMNNEVESLNVLAASSIIMYELMKRSSHE